MATSSAPAGKQQQWRKRQGGRGQPVSGLDSRVRPPGAAQVPRPSPAPSKPPTGTPFHTPQQNLSSPAASRASPQQPPIHLPTHPPTPDTSTHPPGIS